MTSNRPGPVALAKPGTASQSHRATLLTILGGLTALGPLSIDTYLPALPKLTHDLHASASLIQLTLTACLVGLALGQGIAGPLSDRYGRRGPLLLGMAMYALASLLCLTAPSIQLLIIFRLIQGTAGGTAIVIARAVVRDVHEGVEAARFFGTLMQVSGVAPILAPLVGGLLLKATPWRGLFAVLAALGLLLGIAVYRGLPETLPSLNRRTKEPVKPRPDTRSFITDRAFLSCSLSGGFAFAAMFAYISGASFVIEKVYGLPPLTFSLIFAVNGTGIVLAGAVSSRLAVHAGPRRLVRIGSSISLLGGLTTLMAVLSGLNLWLLLPGLFLLVSAIGLILPNSVALALSGRPPQVAGTASSILGLSQFAIGGLAAPLSGIAGPHTALPMSLVIAVLTAAAFTASLSLPAD